MNKAPLSKTREAKFGAAKTQKVWERCKGKCSYCGVNLRRPNTAKDSDKDYADKVFTLDHLTPISKGGSNKISNLKGCCRKCNNIRGSGSLDFLRFKLCEIQEGFPRFNVEQFDFLVSKGINIGILVGYKFYFELQKKG